MKRLFYLILLLPILALGQSTDQNYIKTTVYKVGTQNGTNQTVGGTAVTDADKTVNIGYFDGMGRPIQQIAYKQSAEGKNIIIPIVYDALGRKTKDYLPFPSESTSLLFTDNTSVIGSLESLYSSFFPTEGQNPYSEKQLESSPLNRVQKQSAPGSDWALPVLPADPDHTIRFDYLNNNTDEVRLFTAVSSESEGQYNISLVNGGYFLKGQLFKTKVKDENWKNGDDNTNTTDEFKDKQGRVLLKRSYESGTAFDTYYVYDQFGNLTYVLPPKVNTALAITNPILEGLCYQYKYDNRNRLVEKRLPGKTWEYIVYDKLDRVVATGPSNSPFTNLQTQGWLMTKYDKFNRVLLTAWKEASINSGTRKLLQDLHDTRTIFSETRASATTINGVAFNYSNQAEPTAGYHILTINYYDDYNFASRGTGQWLPSVLSISSLGQNVYYNDTRKPKGLATGSWVRVLETSTTYRNERSYMLYDAKSRPILVYKWNYLLGNDFARTLYDFEGKVLQTQTEHKRLGTSTALTVNDYFMYTDQGRLLLHTHKVNNQPSQVLARNSYDKLGQLIGKKVGGNDLTGTTCLQNVNYTYNIRGWLKSINNMDALQQSNDPKDLFAFALNYNTITNDLSFENDVIIKRLYNGNISETFWKTSSDDFSRKYGYAYDDLNRLTDAIYQKPDLGLGSPTEVTHSYDERITYDKNGNIITLKRNGYLDSPDPDYRYEIDDLGYVYANNSNELQSVNDQSGSLDGFRDGNQQGNPEHSNDYRYDDYGNMTEDWNKGIKNITYNHLNLPVKIVFTSNGEKTIEYLYNAVGVKLSKRVAHNDDTNHLDNSTLYLGGFQYLDTVLQFFPTSEGYVSVTGTNYNYVFNYTDHLENIRLSYTKDPATGVLKILEQSHYYPYGMKHANYNDSKHDYGHEEGGIFAIIKPVIRSNYQYKYNGQEYQDELGLNMYDMDFRDYDPAIARWTGIDPVLHYSQSTYNAFDGNPVFWADPSGADATTYVRGGDGEWKQSSFQSDEEFKDDLRRFGLPDYLNHLSQGNSTSGTSSMRNIILTVGSKPIGQAITWAYPDQNNTKFFLVPTYELTVKGTDSNGKSVTKSFEVIRFGVHTDSNGNVFVVGLADEQTYTIKNWISSYSVHSASSTEIGAWQVSGNYLIHDGPDNPMKQIYATAGCIEICGGPRGFDAFNKFLLDLSGASNLSQLGKSGAMKITYLQASRPPLIEY